MHERRGNVSWEWRLADSRRTGRNLYGDETIPPQPPAEKTPKLLRAMRALVKTSTNFWQSRSELFLKQARLMANYEDDYDYRGTVNQYFPTYDSLTDPELRGYFTWRTKVRRGAVERHRVPRGVKNEDIIIPSTKNCTVSEANEQVKRE